MANSEASPGWDIQTACAVRLGKIFGPGGKLAGQTLDIDTEAISETLHTLDPESGGKLLFEAVHDDSLNYGLGACHGRADPMEDGVRVKVSVGGGFAAALEDKATRQAFIETRRGMSFTERNTYQGEVELEHKLMVLAHKAEIIRGSTDIQATATHELQHAVDFQNPSLVNRDKRYQKTADFVAEGVEKTWGPVLLTAAYGVFEILRKRRSGRAVSAAGGLATFAAGVAGWGRLSRLVNFAAYKSSPMERRAFKKEKLPSSKPIITIG